jgi:alpha,alpha-trehalase
MGTLDYGVVGNCRSAALISSRGSIDWLCFPDFDSPSIFARILDPKKGGHFSIEVAPDYRISQNYLNHTNILSTRFESDEGAFEMLDFMPRYPINEYGKHYLPPEIYRLFRLISGRPRLRIDYQPALNYGKDQIVHKTGPTYIKTISTSSLLDAFYLYSNLGQEVILNHKEFVLEGNRYILLSYNQKLVKIDQDRVELEYRRTRVYWLDWINRSKKFITFNEEIERSVLILKLMAYHPTGAVLAAITTSIPETEGETRNWDYRFCWLRDASMSIKTLLSVGHRGTAKDFMDFILNILRSKDETFQIMYGIRGERILTEKTLDHLSGFAHSRPVRIGNAAYNQKQNDSPGYLLDVIWQYYQHFPGTLNEIEDMWSIVKNIVHNVYETWREPDNGIWEIRGQTQHFVHSKVMSWVALDRSICIATLLHENDYAQKWSLEAERIRKDIIEKGWKESIQSFSQTYENEELDSSLLLMETYNFMPAWDARLVKTVHAIQKGLMHEGLLYRYKTADDFGQPKSAFTICTFWLVQALNAIGEKDEALRLYKELLTYSNHLGLFSEDLDFETKKQLGNFPQAYSHLALINCGLLFTEEIELSHFIRP